MKVLYINIFTIYSILINASYANENCDLRNTLFEQIKNITDMLPSGLITTKKYPHGFKLKNFLRQGGEGFVFIVETNDDQKKILALKITEFSKANKNCVRKEPHKYISAEENLIYEKLKKVTKDTPHTLTLHDVSPAQILYKHGNDRNFLNEVLPMLPEEELMVLQIAKDDDDYRTGCLIVEVMDRGNENEIERIEDNSEEYSVGQNDTIKAFDFFVQSTFNHLQLLKKGIKIGDEKLRNNVAVKSTRVGVHNTSGSISQLEDYEFLKYSFKVSNEEYEICIKTPNYIVQRIDFGFIDVSDQEIHLTEGEGDKIIKELEQIKLSDYTCDNKSNVLDLDNVSFEIDP
ncbi:hypothetical protein OAB57_03380 [Bacteriovoracaceae bacterium]|nr:hypothetical protein [Bacteriovoracaceae bacterium]